MQLDVADLVKVAAAFGSAGGMFAFLRPFAAELFRHRLERARARAQIDDAKDGALGRIAVAAEREVGILEHFATTIDRMDARLDRVEAHLGITLAASAIPPASAPVEPRRALTDPHGVAIATASGA